MKAIAMRRMLSIAIVATFVAGATSSFAQGRIHERQRERERDRAEIFRDVSKDLLTAEKRLRNGFPVYEGHRVMAIELNHLATVELRMAADGDHLTPNQARRNFRESLDDIRRKPERADRRYTPAEIESSNRSLREALDLEVSVRATLRSMRRDPNGHLSNTIATLDKTIDEINAGLDLTRRRRRRD